MSGELEGQIAIVTGGAGGIGGGIAERWRGRRDGRGGGHRRRRRAERIGDELRAAGGSAEAVGST